MAKLATQDQSEAERLKEANLATTSLLARMIPAVESTDYTFPVIIEAIEMHDAAKLYVNQLRRTHSSVEVLAKLQAWIANRRTPVLDDYRARAEAAELASG